MTPDYLFESSWEVCNKVGGIYTVLSTKAQTLYHQFGDKLIFIGPDIWNDNLPSDFIPDDKIYADWRRHAQNIEGFKLKTGRWNVPGKPVVILIDLKSFFKERDTLFFIMWEHFKIDSTKGYGDYEESCVFAGATGKVIESFYNFYHLSHQSVAALFNEWMLSMGALYLKLKVPAIATLFTTHATSIGRSIAGNNKALYAYMEGYNGDQMAEELHVEAKHALEKTAAHEADCFTTVSDITARECKQLLNKAPDIVTPNGFEPGFVPDPKKYPKKRKEAREALINMTEKLLGCKISKDALLVSTSGRYEYRNKGLDVFIEAMNRLRHDEKLNREVVAFITVPAWVREARADLKEAIAKNIETTAPLQMPFATHWLNEMEQDRVLNYIRQCGFTNGAHERVKIIFVPCYLDGKDGILNKPYYDVLIGMDATVYPSYYEPWGYTPLESIAFGIPTITTDLAGFGLWAKNHVSGLTIQDGVAVITRTDFNYEEVAEAIKEQLQTLSVLNTKVSEAIKESCFELAAKAEWIHFIQYYDEAFVQALGKAQNRNC